jgi:translocation and assembly module TamA
MSAALRTGLLLALASPMFAASSGGKGPCPGVVFTGPAVKLTEVERKLLCGDPSTEGWAMIPSNQAEYFMRAFLQQRGYQDPRFRLSGGVLSVDIGPKTRVTELRVEGLPPGVDSGRLRGIKGRDLTPAELDRVKGALLALLQDEGYPCPEIELSADGETGVVRARVALGAPGVLDGIVPAQLENVDPRVFDRYEAFRRGQLFDMRLLSLTAARTVSDALFVSAYYDVSCSTAGAAIEQRAVEGKPRVYRLGAGFDTEGYAIGKAQWQKSRIGWRDSSLEGSLYASFREESAEASMRSYVAPDSRLYLMPQVLFDREDQVQYQYVTGQASLQPGASWDGEELRAELLAGPLEEHITTVRGVGPANDTFLAFKTKWDLTDHLYEYYAAEPRRGWRVTVETLSRAAGVASSLTAHRVTARGEALWNVGGYDPPAFVLGERGWIGTTYVDDIATARRDLAPDMRFFLGGDSNLRGAPLNGLPSDQSGFFTVVYDGVEARMGDDLPYGLQPLAFVDAAMGGRTDSSLQPDVYWSPGIGLRWRLPVGSIRGTVARGLLWRRDGDTTPFAPRWQFFFSFGEEF